MAHAWAWYWAEVKGNLLATPIIAVVVGLYVRFRHTVAEEAHRELMRKHIDHAKDLARLIDALDPSTDGGVGDMRTKLDVIKDEIDLITPGGIGEIIHKLTKEKT
jgi:hypothetical protein